MISESRNETTVIESRLAQKEGLDSQELMRGGQFSGWRKLRYFQTLIGSHGMSGQARHWNHRELNQRTGPIGAPRRQRKQVRNLDHVLAAVSALIGWCAGH